MTNRIQIARIIKEMDYQLLSTVGKIKRQINNLKNYENLSGGGLRTLKMIEDLVDQLDNDLNEKQ